MKHPAHKIVFFTLFLDLLGFGIIIPIQPFWAERFGAEPWLITLLGATYSLMQFLFVPWWGRLSDKLGRRPIMLSSIAISVIAYLIFASAESLWWLFVGRALAGFGNANLATAQAIVADTTAPEDRAKGMGMVGAAFGLGFVFGPALGGAFAQVGERWPGYVAAMLGACNWTWAYFKLPETRLGTGAAHSLGHGTQQLLRLMSGTMSKQTSSFFVTLALMSLLYTFAFSSMEQVIGLFIEHTYVVHKSTEGLHRLQESSWATAMFLLVVGVTLALVQGGVIGKLVRRWGEIKVLQVGLAIVAVSFLLIPLASRILSQGQFLFVGVILAAGSGLVGPSVSSLVSRHSPTDRQGEYLGINQSASAVGRVLGPGLAGSLFQASPFAPFLLGALVIGCLCLVSLKLALPERAID